MVKDTKTILKNILLFGLILTIADIIGLFIFKSLYSSKDFHELAVNLRIEDWIWRIIRISVLFWALRQLTRKLEVFRYGKLVIAALGIVIVDYHLYFVYDMVDYYIIHEPPPDPGQDALQNILSLMQYRPKPEYTPYRFFLLPLTDILFFIRYGEFTSLFFLLLFGSITLPCWVSTVTFFIFRNKDRNNKVFNDNTLIDE